MNNDIMRIEIKDDVTIFTKIKPASQEAGFFESIVIK